tara:strand:+ start:3547 stop:4209 length:663 start_codon:yes stop_codon:yes gene_type:complete
MSDYSNNHLAILLVLTGLVIVVGTLISLYRIDLLDQTVPVTGAVTGSVDVTISSTTFITISGTIDFGTLSPGTWNSSENASLTEGGVNHLDHWNNTNVTSNFTVQNDGSVPIDIEIYDQNQTSDTAGNAGFTGTTGCITTNTCYYVRCATVEDNGTGGSKCADARGVYTAMPLSAGTVFAESVNYTDSKDQAFFLINLTVPSDNAPQNITQQITFSAAAS